MNSNDCKDRLYVVDVVYNILLSTFCYNMISCLFGQWCIRPMDARISCICCSAGSPPTHLWMLCIWSIVFARCKSLCPYSLQREYMTQYWSEGFSLRDVTLARTPGPTHIIIGMVCCMPLCCTLALLVSTSPRPYSERSNFVILVWSGTCWIALAWYTEIPVISPFVSAKMVTGF